MNRFNISDRNRIADGEIVFHIGHYKTATKWLQGSYFGKHPDINLLTNYKKPRKDEFIAYLIGSTDRKYNPSHCRAILEKKIALNDNNNHKVFLITAERLSGHPYSGGYDSFRLAERINASFPEAKIVCVIRNQVDMLLSTYKQLVKEGYLGTCVDLLNSKHWKSVAFSKDMFEYDLLIKKYYTLFSPDKVLVLLYEDLQSDSESFLKNLSRFLNISSFIPTNINQKVHKSPSNKKILMMRFLNRLRSSELNPKPLFTVNNNLINFMALVLSKVLLDKEILSGEDIEGIKRYYYESNMRLKDCVTGNLSKYY